MVPCASVRLDRMGRSTYSERLVEAMGSKEIDAIKALAKSAKISYQGAVK